MRPRFAIWALGLSLATASVFAVGVSLRSAPVSRLHFEPNRGQTDARVRYLVRGAGYSFYLTDKDAVMVLASRAVKPPLAPSSRAQAMRLSFPGARAATLDASEPLGGVSHYLVGAVSNWVRDVPQYGRVTYRGLYPGIDLTVYGNDQQIEYDLVVAPGADPEQIRIRYEGARSQRLDKAGNLVLETEAGPLVQKLPQIYQMVDGRRRAVAGRYQMKSGDVRVKLAGYDRKRPLVIDPVLVFSTYWGGTADEWGMGIAVDTSGNAYVTGYTASTNFPTRAAYDRFVSSRDAFVTKMTPAGTVVYSTYLGGSGAEEARGVALDAARNAYVFGHTDSTNFPTLHAFKGTHGFGDWDTFVTKLNPSGSALVYSTYLGGSLDEFATAIAVDGAGSAYVGGSTASTNFPTLNPFQGTKGSGVEPDTFITKLSPSGSSLVYSTHLGGSGSDYPGGLAVDASGNAYLSGWTSSADFPTLNAFQPSLPGLGAGYVVRLNPAGGLGYATYLGGSSFDMARGMAVDATGSAYVTGNTYSTDFPTLNPFQPNSFGNQEAFVTKLSFAGVPQFSTYLGGSLNESGDSIAVDSGGFIHVSGQSSSFDFPALAPLQTSFAGFNDAFVSRFRPAGNALTFSTRLGSFLNSEAVAIALDSAGNAYITGMTDAQGFPTRKAAQPTYRGGGDAFIAKIGFSHSRGDYSGDGKADILWRYGPSAASYVWEMDGPTPIAQDPAPGVSDPNWLVVGQGDHDGDGSADILWWNSSNGVLYLWRMSGATVLGLDYVATVPDTNWHVAKVADFNGDGTADVIWRHASSGDMYVWLMRGGAILAQAYAGTLADTNWQIAAADDFTGLGRASLLWRNAATGVLYMWFMNGATVTAQSYVDTVGDLTWQIAGTGDYDGDGHADILWRNTTSGSMYVFRMEGAAVLSQDFAGTVAGSSWQIVGTGDYGGDGKADILWRNSSSGVVYLWTMDGATSTAQTYVATIDTNWSIVPNP